MRQLRLVLVALLLATTGLYAQEGFYYQAVIKNTDGSPLKESEIRIRIRIIEGETTLQFEEEKTITTSREGFVSFIIGESKPDEFATINWQGELYLQDEVDTGEGYGAPTKMPLLKTPRSYISDRAISVLDNSITSASILDQTILTEDLADSSITTEKLADSLITSNKIAKNAVVKESVAIGSISTEAVIDETLTNIDISPNAAINVSKIDIPNESIPLEKIEIIDGAIKYSKLTIADDEIPFSKIQIEDQEIPFEKLNIIDENNSSILNPLAEGGALFTGNVIGNLSGEVTGTVSSLVNHDTDALKEGATNLYYTDLRAQAAISAGTGVSINEGEITIGQAVGTADNVVFNQVNANFIGNFTGDILAPDGAQVLSNRTDEDEAIFNGIVEGTVSSLANHNTDSLEEGPNNLYYTNERAQAAISAGTGVLVNDGEIAIGQAVGTSDDVTFNRVISDIIGNIYNTDAESILEIGTSDIAAIYTGNVTGNLTGNLIGGGGKTVLANGNNTTIAKYFGDMYYREDDGTETQLIDSKNKIFFGTFKGSWDGNIIGENNTVILNPVAEGGALFIGNVEGNLTGNVTGDITGNVEGDLYGNADSATVASTTTITDNDGSINEENAIVFTPDAVQIGGNLALESNQNLTYNPSTGTLSTTTFNGALNGDLTGTILTPTQNGITTMNGLTSLGTSGENTTFNGPIIASEGIRVTESGNKENLGILSDILPITTGSTPGRYTETFNVPGVTTTSIITATLFSSKEIYVESARAGTDTITITFSAQPSEATSFQYIAIVKAP
jgi:hypothetical protein